MNKSHVVLTRLQFALHAVLFLYKPLIAFHYFLAFFCIPEKKDYNVQFQSLIFLYKYFLLVVCFFKAVYGRDALCKAIYNKLFTWIIHRINDRIRVSLMLFDWLIYISFFV